MISSFSQLKILFNDNIWPDIIKMKMAFLHIVLLISIVSSVNVLAKIDHSKGNDDELISVAVLYRHGDRGPMGSYPNDPYFDIRYWPNGFGQLVDQGKRHQFKVGRWLRNRYADFISENYKRDEIVIRSSDVDRTLMSAAANLAGLFYLSTSKTWQKGLPWDPVPIHTVPQYEDEIISMSKNCNKFDKLYSELCDSEYFKKVTEEHESIFRFVFLETGWNITDLSTLQGLYTTLYVYKTLNASFLPDWAFQLDEDELSYLAGLSFSRETFTKDLQRFKVGPFINYLNNHFDGVINGTTPKFLMLSGHDGTVASILNTFGAYDNHPPEFCSTIIWELKKNQKGYHYLNIFYRRNSTGTLERIVVDGCSFNCKYVEYKNILRPVTVDSTAWTKECSDDAED